MEEEGAEAEVFQVGNKAVRGCLDCGFCQKNGRCVLDDVVNELAPNVAQVRTVAP